MSYILDALKRADAEREQGRVPGLHAHPLDPGAPARREQPAPRWSWWAGAAAGAVVLAALAWRMGADANMPPPTPLPPAPADPVAQNLAPAGAALPRPAPQPAVGPVVPSYAPPPAAVRPAPDPRPAAAARAASAVPPVATPVGTPAATAAPATRLPWLAELPASLRQQLPSLTVSGSVYSDDAKARFILLNGDVAREGSRPAPGLVVERIEPRSAVLSFQGERFRLPY
jgi:general secretion pathway protein B